VCALDRDLLRGGARQGKADSEHMTNRQVLDAVEATGWKPGMVFAPPPAEGLPSEWNRDWTVWYDEVVEGLKDGAHRNCLEYVFHPSNLAWAGNRSPLLVALSSRVVHPLVGRWQEEWQRRHFGMVGPVPSSAVAFRGRPRFSPASVTLTLALWLVARGRRCG